MFPSFPHFFHHQSQVNWAYYYRLYYSKESVRRQCPVFSSGSLFLRAEVALILLIDLVGPPLLVKLG
jgi:hypothetical protein